MNMRPNNGHSASATPPPRGSSSSRGGSSSAAQQLQTTALAQTHSAHFYTLVRRIGECKSRTEEITIATKEAAYLKGVLAKNEATPEVLIRLLYAEMLGADASFAYIHAVKATHSSHLQTKRLGHLLVQLFLTSKDPLMLLLINTCHQDLKSADVLVVCAALHTLARLTSEDTIPAVLPTVVELLNHKSQLVRKKAVMVLSKFQKVTSDATTKQMLQQKFCLMLCDKDPSVMGASLNGLHDALCTHMEGEDLIRMKNLVPSLVSILKQITQRRLPRSYEYHRTPAPFIQIKLLKMLAKLGQNDQASSEHMYQVLSEVLKANGRQPSAQSHTSTIQSALVFETIRTIATIYPSTELLTLAAQSTSALLRSKHRNLKYVGIDSLMHITRVNPSYAQEHQMAVVDCLEDSDDTIRRKTFDLLAAMTTQQNVEVVVEKMSAYLTDLNHLSGMDAKLIRSRILTEIANLAERHAPSVGWYVEKMRELLELGGDDVPVQLCDRVIAACASDDGVANAACQAYGSALRERGCDVHAPFFRVAAAVLGEHISGADAAASTARCMISTVEENVRLDDAERALVASAMGKLVSKNDSMAVTEVSEFAAAGMRSRSTELAQRCGELKELLHTKVATASPGAGSGANVAAALAGASAYAATRGGSTYVPVEERRRRKLAEAVAAGGVSVQEASASAPPPQSYLERQAVLQAAKEARASASAGLRKSGAGARQQWGGVEAPPPPPPPQVQAPQVAAAASAAPSVQPAIEPAMPDERASLAAALFGGGGTPAPVATAASAVAAEPPPPPPSPAPVAAAAQPSPVDPFAMLSSLDAAPPAPPVDPFAQMGEMGAQMPQIPPQQPHDPMGGMMPMQQPMGGMMQMQQPMGGMMQMQQPMQPMGGARPPPPQMSPPPPQKSKDPFADLLG
ncbi:hypothetical protein PPROV_001107000 [Pycnococcus provasolii]|uniref:Clathrin/coatomer adaptor adaptin-like N-terminal domain-containing protein n=1 Tax=Pycnococcus provasolii TaxID=41880 RepID=A0A830HYN0_9CHLO|nr:hypothetical protein PPROV_001107000 [Pycnococcus provasolii]